MKRFILTSMLLAGAMLAGSANLDAAPPHGHPAPHGRTVVHGHPAPHGRTVVHVHPPVAHAHAYHFSHYHVRGYSGWSWRCWFPAYRSYGYYSAADGLWFYWYAPLNQYLPVTYMATYPPTPMAAPVGVLPTGLPQSPGLPAGATIVPGPITAP